MIRDMWVCRATADVDGQRLDFRLAVTRVSLLHGGHAYAAFVERLAGSRFRAEAGAAPDSVFWQRGNELETT